MRKILQHTRNRYLLSVDIISCFIAYAISIRIILPAQDFMITFKSSLVFIIISSIVYSLVLVILGIYSTIIAAISDFNLPIICLMAVGVLIGIFAGAKGVQVLLDKVPNQTYGAIFGLVIGSVFAVLPIKETGVLFADGKIGAFVMALICAVAGFAVAFFSGREEN